MDNLYEGLCKKVKLDRDKALAELANHIKDEASNFDFHGLSQQMLSTLRNQESTWEALAGCLEASCILLESRRMSREIAESVEDAAFALLENREFRVRMSAAECIGKCCSYAGDSSVYRRRKASMFDAIRANLIRETEHQQINLSGGSSTCSLDAEMVAACDNSAERRPRSPSPSRAGMTKDEIFHDTAGWKSLETWMKCLEYAVCGCGTSFLVEVDTELFELCETSTLHVNRFVRESTYNVLAAICECERQKETQNGVAIMTRQHGDRIATQLYRGLCDNWSQVRLAASTAARQFLLGCDDVTGPKYLGVLLPPLCLNRYYAAEGVRTYGHETWRLLTHGEGVRLVQRHIDHVVAFYIEQSEADNHAVREAACVCLAELGAKIDRDVLKQHVPRMLSTLIECFSDESWPVRDGACVACGNLVLAFPEDAEAQLNTLVPLFVGNLCDSIPSVRQGAATALGNLLKKHASTQLTMPPPLTTTESAPAETHSLLDFLCELMRSAFEQVKQQPQESERYSEVEKKPAVYGVIKRARDNDAELHTDQTMYSCGSLAPRMGRKRRELCACERALSRTFTRAAQNWEVADGCLLLLSETAQLENATAREAVQKLLITMQKAVALHHYTMHVSLLETCCKVLVRLATGLTLRVFKRYFELFVDDLFYAARCENRLTESAAADCIVSLSKMMGDQIFRGRLQQCPQATKYLEIYEHCLAGAANLATGVSNVTRHNL